MTDIKSIDQLTIRLIFFGPYRITDWVDRGKRRNHTQYQRFLSYGNWHNPKNGGKLQNPYFRGTLIRSQMIRQLENIFMMFPGEFAGFCPGHAEYNKKLESRPSRYIQHRERFSFSGKALCESWDEACPACQLMGVFDAQQFRKNADNLGTKYCPKTAPTSVSFSNLLPHNHEGFKRIVDLCQLKFKNRFDTSSKKAKDYFKVLEANHLLVSEYRGTIDINTTLVKDVETVKGLLAVGLANIQYLAAAPCRIYIGGQEPDLWNSDDHQRLISQFFRKQGDGESPKLKVTPQSQNPNKALEREGSQLGEKIIGIVQKNNKAESLREYADVILDLGKKTDQQITNLPTEKKATGMPTFWGLKKGEDSPAVKTIIEDNIINKDVYQQDRNLRTFVFRHIGQYLYKRAKDLNVLELKKERILGENEFYARPFPKSSPDRLKKADDLSRIKSKWIITGYLVAKTPFHSGKGSTHKGLIDMPITTDSKGHPKITHDVLRGALREDLDLVLSGCNYQLGTENPCDCPVCEVWTRCKPESSAADERDIPLSEIRKRNRINPAMGVVEEGALFNTEMGLEGLRFPVIIRFDSKMSEKVDGSLLKILSLWADGQCWIGGQKGTGKGRFKLVDLNFFRIWGNEGDEFKDFEEITRQRGYIGCTKCELENALVEYDPKEIKWPDLPSNGFTKVKYRFSFESPVLVNDPVEAMYDQNTPDAVMFSKTVIQYNDDGMVEAVSVQALKGEGIRGPVRYLVGKKANVHGIIHEDCPCDMCRIFGNSQTGGLIRFEDATPVESVEPQRFDHVALNWNQGVKGHAKFDDYALPGSKKKPYVFKGIMWIKDDIDIKFQRCLRDAFIDLQDGMTTIGSNGSIGYGRINRIEFEEGPEWLMEDFPEKPVEKREPLPEAMPKQDVAPAPLEAGHYNPYYYLSPLKKVKRNGKPVTHDRYHNRKLTGKIICDLETLGPVFTPDTSDDKAFDAYVRSKADDKIADQHKSHRFFRLNEKVSLQGSGIRGMVEYVYGLITNSCFRNLDEKRYLTRRMTATEGANLDKGIVRKDKDPDTEKLYIHKIQKPYGVYRLPLYDDLSVTKTIGDYPREKYEEWLNHNEILAPEKDLSTVISNNKTMACYAKKNRTYLENKRERKGILAGTTIVKFNLIKEWANSVDKIAELRDDGELSGFLKFTGLNNANKKSDIEKDDLIDLSESNREPDRFDLQILLSDQIPEMKKSGNYYYPRPVFHCVIEESQYSLSKRCERIFEDPSEGNLIDGVTRFYVTQKARNQYRDLIESYNKNADHIAELFRTKLQNDRLTDGDLVYFRPDGNNAKNIVPVSISRKSDADPLGKRFPKGFEGLMPCDAGCLEECETCSPECLQRLFAGFPKGLCPTCSLFGTTNYRGRVWFGFGHLVCSENEKEGNPVWYKETSEETGIEAINQLNGFPLTLKLLERPRETWPIPNFAANIPGRKVYVNHPQPVTLNSKIPTQNNTTIEPLAEGNIFRFQIDFDNLFPWELGLLLYTLELEPGMAHRFGHGKPLGLGSVKIDVRDILIRNNTREWKSHFACKENYLTEGKKKCEYSGWFNQSWEDMPQIKALRGLLALKCKDSDIGIEYLDGIDGHEDFKKNWNWYERQAILSTPWHPLSANELTEDAKQLSDKIFEATEHKGKIIKYREDTGKGTIDIPGSEYIFFKKSGMISINKLKKGVTVSFRVAEDKKTLDLIATQEQTGNAKLSNSHFGTVKWFRNGYGFITPDKGSDDVFIHHSNIDQEGFRTLEEDQRVEYKTRIGKKGLEAFNVRITE